ncbi:MAG: aldehyde dehydrogenase family protein [Gammaproteobacteria bacterium]|nr:aldehyde dehydrogenase family protein [Gammaproteobacteria bacterium]NNC96516.1 aldehyde dehydrogenase family protein [Gammaproteobacteria bacterium]NNM12749.1 aldehyde dehydrogenase family protein [Gammaproteobacteria bacterium]
MQANNVVQIPTAHNSSLAEIDRIFALQQNQAIKLRTSTYKDRLALLNRFETVFNNAKQKMYDAAFADYGKTEAEVDLTEIFAVTAELKHTKRHLKKWMKPQKVRPTLASLGTQAKIIKEPKGVCLVISPWNYPYNLSFGPMLTALAAGNTVMLKPSELTPNMSRVIREIVEESFSPEMVSVFEGDVDVAAHLTNLPFDHIFFTGSPAVGKIVMGAAAKHLTSVTLELGGKSPTIVDQSADIKKAARNISWGKFANNGQTCIAPDYLFVHDAVKDEFISEFKHNLQKLYGDSEKIQENPDYCRIVNNRHFNRVNNILEDAIENGATLINGGQKDAATNFIAPTVLSDVTPESKILQEEIFGPLLPIMSYSDIKQVVDYINDKPKPLALYVYSKDNAVINKVLSETSSGDACINHNMVQFLHLNLPFGGVNNSGIGKAHGDYGFKAFSHERSVLRDRFSTTHMFFPPYKNSVKKMIKQAIKYFT